MTKNISTGSAADEKLIWDALMAKIGNAYGVAAMMGNLYAESGLKSDNLQNNYERTLGYTDSTYTAAVDGGEYTNFVTDKAGYGLAQWTYWSRKKALLAYAKAQNASVGDVNMQLAFLIRELSESYKAVLTALQTATSVRAASDVVLKKFENPADQSASVQVKRASYGQKYYDKYAGTGAETATEISDYSRDEFIRDCQKAFGVAVDGIVGVLTLGAAPTLSRHKNAAHAALKPVQRFLSALGYTEVGTADGIAGAKFASAVAHYQQDKGLTVDGIVGKQTWTALLRG